jgi:hypothetical protein
MMLIWQANLWDPRTAEGSTAFTELLRVLEAETSAFVNRLAPVALAASPRRVAA